MIFCTKRLRDFFCPKRLRGFFGPDRLSDFFGPKRLHDFFSVPRRYVFLAALSSSRSPCVGRLVGWSVRGVCEKVTIVTFRVSSE